MQKALFLLGIIVFAVNVRGQEITQGSLFAQGKGGKQLGACPLKTTAVNVDISGFVARVRVVQDFQNSFTEPIEAVYTFPLSQNGAVDEMTMTIGTRTIHGKVLKREEAKKVYETAKSEGKTASLLDQERPNIFTQSVANIMPGESVKIEISYVETLNYEDGSYEFAFPMVVGPRYIPRSVTDKAKITPPIAATRAGHDISINVNLNAGVPVEEIRSTSHDIDQSSYSPNVSKVGLRNEKTIPNKDFILKYDVSGKRIEDAVIAHHGERGGFFTLVLQPPDKIASEDRTPKEIVFVLDTSGSMSGFPIEKAKEAMKLSLDGLYPDDTFNLITFAGDTNVLFDEPVPATQANLERAQAFLDTRHGGGGTEMMKAIKAALDPTDSKTHLRIVCFMTDGYVGNENEIVAEIQRHPQARVFSFGIGSSVNRFLLDKMAEAGKGEVEYVALNDDGSKAAKKFYERVRSPLLTDLSIDWNGLPVADVYPSKLTDLFSAKPVVVNGRFTRGAKGTIKLRGKVAGQSYERDITVNLPESEMANDSLASLWARKRIGELSNDAINSKDAASINKQITDLGLEFRLLTQFTSFVAVEERVVNQNGNPTKVEVPIEIPEGVDINMAVSEAQEVVTVSGGRVSGGLFKRRSRKAEISNSPANVTALTLASPSPQTQGTGSGSGMGQGSGNASGYGSSNSGGPPRVISGGVMNGRAVNLPRPAYPEVARTANASGTVTVQVTIDETGKVIAAVPVAGNPLFRQAAEQAARGATFTPTMMSGKPVKITGVITYNFGVGAQTATASAQTGDPVAQAEALQSQLTPEQLLKKRQKEKLHAWLFAVLERLEKKTPPTQNESKFVKEGKAEIRIVLSTQSPELKERLKALGFDIVSEKGLVLTGRIEIEKLAAFAEIEEIKYLLPNI